MGGTWWAAFAIILVVMVCGGIALSIPMFMQKELNPQRMSEFKRESLQEYEEKEHSRA